MRRVRQWRTAGAFPDTVSPASTCVVLTWPADLLAVPNLSARPCQRAELDRLQDVPPNLQPRAAHRLRVCRAPAQGEDQGECIARDRAL